MNLISKIEVRNFKCFRAWNEFNLDSSSYFIGANNSGKSAVLLAIDCFFNPENFKSDFINKTELRGRLPGYNKSEIKIIFELKSIEKSETLKKRLIKNYGSTIEINRTFTYKEITDRVVLSVEVQGKEYEYDDLDQDLQKLLSRISVSYIHPQESKELLSNAQLKLKKRLLNNWGRSSQLSDTLKNLQDSWDELRSKANNYLSAGLTNSLQDIWNDCKVNINLPTDIEDIIGISQIEFQGNSNIPSVPLTSQGTGAQSTILYQTHYLLDSDRTLHRGFYHAIWLLEEPESFLHADIIIKLGGLLNSNEWLDNVQMLVSTHSALLLATTKQNSNRIIWNLMDQHTLKKSQKTYEWDPQEIKEIGILMGDPNFDVYFNSSLVEDLIFIEDKRELTETKLLEAGIKVSKRLNGSTDQRRYFDVLRSIDFNFKHRNYFIVDNDDGIKVFNNSLDSGTTIETTESNFQRIDFGSNVSIILLPKNWIIEDLFEAFDSHVEECVYILFNDEFTTADLGNIPGYLSRAHAEIRNKKPNGLTEAKLLVKNKQDIKDRFWHKVEEESINMSTKYISEIKSLIK